MSIVQEKIPFEVRNQLDQGAQRVSSMQWRPPEIQKSMDHLEFKKCQLCFILLSLLLLNLIYFEDQMKN
ncbi:hypothetical protein B9Z55_028950 [Caenorhabditis nigoni]|uniref:Uncharacterized protein n=1 Tax=Caenorhabditis nigoni TaxID=1611254 RepID=A0A2G5S978_9PELO|nr:hypothetical protein B9Z55_028950 [Caenorhabditis nigoni]